MQSEKDALIERYAGDAFKNRNNNDLTMGVWRQHFVEFADKLAALSAAEPAAWVYAPDLAKGSGGFGKEKGSVLMSLDGEWINVDTPLYAAPPAPSVAVEHLITEVHDAIDEYREGMKGDKFGPHEWPTVDGIKTTVAQSLRRSALSAQVQDVAGSGGMEFPEALTDDLRDVLSTMIWTSGQIAACLRAGGDQIKTRAEDEQAHVLHWLISLALKHGPEWRAKASERIKAIRDAAAPAKQEGGHD